MGTLVADRLVLQPNNGGSTWVCWHVVSDEYRVLGPPVGSMQEFLHVAQQRGLEPDVPEEVYEQMSALGLSPPKPESGRWLDALTALEAAEADPAN